MKINTVSPDSIPYLQILSSIAKSPGLLHYTGSIPQLRQKSVAIVGTRRPSNYGREVTYRLSYDLAQRGIVIVSGLALGIDTIAHTAALDAGGTTIAILGNPLPSISPASNRSLAERIVEHGGLILTEYDKGTRVFPSNFLERNRLVAGLSDAIIITEATSRSGTLNTAARALEQGKEIFAVPGSITSPLSVGCNNLLKQGARVVTSYEDVLNVIAPDFNGQQASLPLGSNELETKIIALIAGGMRDGDALQQRMSVEATEFNTALTMLELSGSIRALGANQWTLR